ncbi:MAG TPA: toxin-antitoxin system HicB family antitoxin [Burkholderiaceae bacterium]
MNTMSHKGYTAAALVAAQAAGKSLNQWATELLKDAAQH